MGSTPRRPAVWPTLMACALAGVLVVGGGAHAAERDNPACSANPLFARFPGEALDNCQHVRFNELKLRRWADPANPRSNVLPLTVEGEYWYYHDPIARDARGRAAGKLEVRRHFEDAVRAGGGTVLYVDEGGGRVHFRWPRPDGEYWGEVGCGGGGGGECSAVSQRIVRAAPVAQAVGVVGTPPAAAGGGPGSLTHGPLGGGPAMPDGRPQTGPGGPGRIDTPPPGGADDLIQRTLTRPEHMDRRKPLMRLVQIRPRGEDSVDHGWIDIVDAQLGRYRRQSHAGVDGGAELLTTEASVHIWGQHADGRRLLCVFRAQNLADAQALVSLVRQPFATVACRNSLDEAMGAGGVYEFWFDTERGRTGR